MCSTVNRDLESQRHEKVNAWICARQTTTDHDLASVIPVKKEREKEEKEKKCKCVTTVSSIFLITNGF